MIDARIRAMMIEIENMQQGAGRTSHPQVQHQTSQHPPNKPDVMPMSPNTRDQILENPTDIPIPNDDAEADWSRVVETRGSPFRSQPAPTGPPQTHGAETAQQTQRQPDPRYLAPELVPPQMQGQSQPVPKIDPCPRYSCQDAYFATQANGVLPNTYPTHIPGPTYHGDGRGAATAPPQVPTSWDPKVPAANRSPFRNSYNSPMPTNQARMHQRQAQQHQPLRRSELATIQIWARWGVPWTSSRNQSPSGNQKKPIGLY